jgi:hypothetical protein
MTVGAAEIVCMMRTCCAGAELQVVKDTLIELREMYPTKSDLHERARELQASYRAGRL